MSVEQLSSASNFESIFRKYSVHVDAYAASHVYRCDVDDVVSSTWETVWQRFDDLPRAQRDTWISGVCRNHCLNTWRARRRQHALIERLGSVRPVSGTERLETTEVIDVLGALSETISRLSTEDRELMWLLAGREHTATEIADLLGVPNGTMRVRIHRLRRRLRRDREPAADSGGLR